MMKRVIQWVVGLALAAVLVVMAISIYILLDTNQYIYSSPNVAPSEPLAIVLGASVTENGTLSPVLRERADTAVTLYKAGKVEKILVTGDDGTLSYDEVDPVGRYLLTQGIPKQDIFLDHAGFDTYSSMYRARAVFLATSTIISSQRFHLARAIFIARALGLNAVGVDASAPGDNYLENSLREIPANVKAVFDLIFLRVPKYLGTQYPVSGDGSGTWVGAQ